MKSLISNTISISGAIRKDISISNSIGGAIRKDISISNSIGVKSLNKGPVRDAGFCLLFGELSFLFRGGVE